MCSAAFNRVVERSGVSFQSGGGYVGRFVVHACRGEDGYQQQRARFVMAYCFAGTRDARMPAYAERFVAADFAVLLFDYRHFGASDGEPRQLISVRRQLEDYANAIAFARSLPWIDQTRIALWGTSFREVTC
jgi:predicted acyl esterase